MMSSDPMLSGMPGHVFRTPPPGEWFPCKITAVPTAGQYTFDEWWLDGDGTWVVKVGGRVGTTLNYGVALTGTFAVNDYAWARAGAGAGGSLFELLPVASSSAGTVTSIVTKEVDGTPSYTFTSTVSMEFDQADGFVLSQPAAGRVKFDLAAATATQAGIVSTAAQTFAGDKDFNDDVNIDGSLTVQLDTFLTGILDVTLNSIFRDYVVMQGVLTVADDGTANGVKAGAPLFRVYDGYGNTGGYNGAFEVTLDPVSYTDTTDRVIAMWGGTGATIQPGQCEINGVIKFRGIADSAAPNSSLYYSTTASKLVYKDAGGTVNNLY